jgi:hypothetical protein
LADQPLGFVVTTSNDVTANGVGCLADFADAACALVIIAAAPSATPPMAIRNAYFACIGFLPCWSLLLNRMGCAQSDGTSIGRGSSNRQTLSGIGGLVVHPEGERLPIVIAHD